MTRPQFSMSFNLGHLLQILSLVIAATIGWITMDHRTTTNAKRLDVVEARDAEQSVRLRNIETTQARADERFISIMSILGRIEGRLERMEGQK